MRIVNPDGIQGDMSNVLQINDDGIMVALTAHSFHKFSVGVDHVVL
jgi:hypothetical protein